MMIVLASVTACIGHRAQQGVGDPKPAGEPKPAAVENGRERATGGNGVPSGYVGRTDDALRRIADVKYRNRGNGWEITTGPAHIMYSASDTMNGEFIVATTFDRMETSAHPEAFGILIGGKDLDQPSQRYTSFMVRGNGEYTVKVREGSEMRDVVPWTTQPALVKPPTEERARYRLAIQVRADSVWFLRNGAPIAAVSVGTIPTDGIAGYRIENNVRVRVDRLRSTN